MLIINPVCMNYSLVRTDHLPSIVTTLFVLLLLVMIIILITCIIPNFRDDILLMKINMNMLKYSKSHGKDSNLKNVCRGFLCRGT